VIGSVAAIVFTKCFCSILKKVYFQEIFTVISNYSNFIFSCFRLASPPIKKLLSQNFSFLSQLKSKLLRCFEIASENLNGWKPKFTEMPKVGKKAFGLIYGFVAVWKTF
jgi:hypothetical protein